MLETLSPVERAAFVLREVFGEPYPVVAEILGREEAATRQLDRATHAEVVRRFEAACRSPDVDALLAVLAPAVVLVGDKVARFLLGIATKPGARDRGRPGVLQRVPRLVARIDGRPVTAVAIDVRGNSVQAVHAVANPAKLAALNPDRTSLVR